MRIGSTKRDLTPPELVRLFQQRGREYVFDEQPVLAASVDALNRHRLEAFFGRPPTIPWPDLLRNPRATFRDEDGVDRPTVADLLAFGTEPTEFLPSGSIEAACYRGTRLSSDDLIHAERLEDPPLLFADRLELRSPGKLPDTLTLDDMPYRTFTRNQLLVGFLSRVRSERTGQVFLESREEGVRKILEDGEAHSGRWPEYELFEDELRVTL